MSTKTVFDSESMEYVIVPEDEESSTYYDSYDDYRNSDEALSAGEFLPFSDDPIDLGFSQEEIDEWNHSSSLYELAQSYGAVDYRPIEVYMNGEYISEEDLEQILIDAGYEKEEDSDDDLQDSSEDDEYEYRSYEDEDLDYDSDMDDDDVIF